MTDLLNGKNLMSKRSRKTDQESTWHVDLLHVKFWLEKLKSEKNGDIDLKHFWEVTEEASAPAAKNSGSTSAVKNLGSAAVDKSWSKLAQPRFRIKGADWTGKITVIRHDCFSSFIG